MKLSKETLTILKNFKSINLGIIFRTEGILRTISQTGVILAEANIKEKFPREFAIADLGKFISIQEMFEDSPELQFNDSNLTISLNNTKLEYAYASLEVIKSFNKKPEYPESSIKFDVSKEDFTNLMKAASALASPNLVVRVQNSKVTISVEDYKDTSAGKYSIELETAEKTQTGTIILRIENLVLLEGDYTVEFVVKGENYLSVFSNKNTSIRYFISPETSSRIEN